MSAHVGSKLQRFRACLVASFLLGGCTIHQDGMVIGSTTTEQYMKDVNECTRQIDNTITPGVIPSATRHSEETSWPCLAEKGYLYISEPVLLNPPPLMAADERAR